MKIEKLHEYKPVSAGEWVRPRKTYYMACCDCGLVHKMEFRIHEGKIQFRAWRSKRATSNVRKAMRDKWKS
jgi:hypothetical protein